LAIVVPAAWTRAKTARAADPIAGTYPRRGSCDAGQLRAPDHAPEVTLAFWIIKIAATTLGETGGDSVTMTLSWGYLTGTVLFLGLLVVLVFAQIMARRVPSLPLLDDDRRLDHLRHDDDGLSNTQ
jgi:hypothetical protein